MFVSRNVHKEGDVVRYLDFPESVSLCRSIDYMDEYDLVMRQSTRKEHLKTRVKRCVLCAKDAKKSDS